MNEIEIKQMQEIINAGILLPESVWLRKPRQRTGVTEQTHVLEVKNITPQKMELYILYILKVKGRPKKMRFSFDLKIRTDFAGWSILRPPAQVGPILSNDEWDKIKNK